MPLFAIDRPMEPRGVMVPSRVEYLSRYLEERFPEYCLQGPHRAADARPARHRQDNTRRRRRKDGSGLGLAALLISLSLWPWSCSAFCPPWSTGGSSFLAHPLQSQSPAKSCRWPVARVSNRGGLQAGATSGMTHECVSNVC